MRVQPFMLGALFTILGSTAVSVARRQRHCISLCRGGCQLPTKYSTASSNIPQLCDCVPPCMLASGIFHFFIFVSCFFSHGLLVTRCLTRLSLPFVSQHHQGPLTFRTQHPTTTHHTILSNHTRTSLARTVIDEFLLLFVSLLVAISACVLLAPWSLLRTVGYTQGQTSKSLISHSHICV